MPASNVKALRRENSQISSKKHKLYSTKTKYNACDLNVIIAKSVHNASAKMQVLGL